MDISSSLGRFEVKWVKNGQLLNRAQALRYKVFFGKNGKDEDRFDKFCEHIVVIDRDADEVIGTYRLLLGSTARKLSGFYSQTEFDLRNIIKSCRGELLEMGRACVNSSYRRYPVINLIWKEIISYVEKYDVKYIFGCASIEHPKPLVIGKVFKFFKDNCFSPAKFRVYPLIKKRYPYSGNVGDYTASEIRKLLPSLIKGYLKMGAFVCGEPVWDRKFDTADFFLMLDTIKMNPIYRDKFHEKKP